MTAHLAARGPDGEGIWTSSHRCVALGHRRLAIIDLSEAGAQPMLDPVTGNCIVFNGEIYNYRELRRELQAVEPRFRSETDTEVLLHLYARHGEAMLGRLRGMYAFAIWDACRQALFLARDPLGIKPLYYADDGKTIRFASQVKALLAGGGVSNEPSAAGVAGFFLWGHVPEPWTWFASIKALPAGTFLTVRRGTPVSKPKPHFDLREEILAAQDSPSTRANAVEECLAAVEESVRLHLVADVPVGLFLSAGRDSTLLGALAARHSSEPLRTVTLGFAEYRGTALDEVPLAEAVARQLSTLHETRLVHRSEFLGERDRILAAMDQPSIDGVNTWFVSRAAAQTGLKVALSGLGGDELFGGYPSFTQIPRLVRRLAILHMVPWLGQVCRIISAPVLGRLTNPKWSSLLEYGSTVESAWMLQRALFLPWEIPALIDPEFARKGLRELAPEDDLRSRVAGIRRPELAVMALEMGGYMRNQLLRDSDWAGMAHSLEIRVPLVDVELLRRWLPLAAHSFPIERQRLLEAANPRVAAIIGEHPKTGFSVPIAQWLQAPTRPSHHGGGLRPWAQHVLDKFHAAPATLRVGVMLTDAYGGIGGIAKFNRDLLAAVAKMPEVLTVTALPRLIQRQPEPIPDKVYFDATAARGKRAYVLRALRLAITPRHMDMVICGHINLLPLGWLVSRMQRAPLLLIVHGIEAWQPHRNLLVRTLLKRTDAIAAVSRYTVERMRTWSGLDESRFRILPNCVDLCHFLPQPRNAALSQRYGLDNRRILLSVGRLVSKERYKGFDEVLEALPQLAQELPDLVYVIVGDGDDRTRLQAKAHALGVADRVVFTGFVSEEDKISLYNLADAYVMPSRGEGFGIVYLEAMACGVPTIGSMVDGSRDALRDGRLGQLVDPGDSEQLIQAIRKALTTPRGRPEGLEYFSEEAYRERVAALVRELVGERA